MLVLEREHGLEVVPEVGVEGLIGEELVDGLAIEVLVLHEHDFQDFHLGLVGHVELLVRSGVLTAVAGNTAVGEVRVSLVQALVGVEDGDVLVVAGGDVLEEVPHALEVVVHFTAAGDDVALAGDEHTVAGTAGDGTSFVNGDVFAGHFRVTDQEAGRCKAGDTGTDDDGMFVFDVFGRNGGAAGLVVTVAVIEALLLDVVPVEDQVLAFQAVVKSVIHSVLSSIKCSLSRINSLC